MNERILVPVDGSEWSLKALDFAGDIAEKYGSLLIILHVVPDSEVPDGLKKWAASENFLNPPEAIYEQAVADRLLDEAASRLGKNGPKSIQRATEHGDAAKRILEVAQREDADLIVMGTRGLSDFQGLILGSVAHKVSHGARCTVVTVR